MICFSLLIVCGRVWRQSETEHKPSLWMKTDRNKPKLKEYIFIKIKSDNRDELVLDPSLHCGCFSVLPFSQISFEHGRVCQPGLSQGQVALLFICTQTFLLILQLWDCGESSMVSLSYGVSSNNCLAFALLIQKYWLTDYFPPGSATSSWCWMALWTS